MVTKVKLGQLFGDMFGYLRTHTLGLLPYLALVVVLIIIVDELLYASFDDTLGWFLSALTTVFISAPIGVMMYRRALGLERAGQWVSDSWSLGLAQLLVYMLFGILLTLIFMFLALFVGILAGVSGFDPSSLADSFETGRISEALGGTEAVLLSALVAVSTLALLWVSIRLVVFGIATVNEGRLMIFRTWNWTKGNAIRIGIFCAIVLLPVSLIPFLVMTGFPQFESSNSLQMRLTHSAVIAPIQIAIFLLGHAAAIAVYRQVAPATVDYEATFS